jgi:hypothetical protein
MSKIMREKGNLTPRHEVASHQGRTEVKKSTPVFLFLCKSLPRLGESHAKCGGGGRGVIPSLGRAIRPHPATRTSQKEQAKYLSCIPSVHIFCLWADNSLLYSAQDFIISSGICIFLSAPGVYFFSSPNVVMFFY